MWKTAVVRQTLVAALAAAVAVPTVGAAEVEVGDGKLGVSGSVFFGEVVRTVRQNTKLLPDVNSSLVGIPGNAITPSMGRNQDDGNLNFNRGDAVSEVVKGYLTLDYKWQDYGALVSGMAWFDFALAQANHPWGNVPNGYAAGQPLGDNGAQPRSKFSGVVADNLYGYGRSRFDGVALDWRIGYQKLDWGNKYIVFGGLRDINPIDIPAALRPGALRDQETRIAIPAAFAGLSLPQSTRIEAFYQIHFQRSAVNECGSFFSQADFLSDGCNAAMVGATNDRTAMANGYFVKRAPTVAPSTGGGAGVALKRTVDDWATEFGLYAVQFDQRRAFFGAVKSLRTGAPYIPGDPDNLNPQYFTEYPEKTQMYGATFNARFGGGAVFGEITFRPNQPLQYNAIDLLNGFLSPLLPTPFRAQVNAAAPGALFHGYQDHQAVQAQLGVTAVVPGVLGSAGLSLGGEVVYKGVPDLPDPSVARFGRSDVFGQGPVNGVCPAPAASVQCSMDGYVSRHAFGYRLQAGLLYPRAIEGVDLVPSVFFGQDVYGWSGDGGILQGRFLAIASLRANFAKGWTAQIAWQPTWGGAYNNQSDRSTAFANVGFQF